jgi:hypothetical protein
METKPKLQSSTLYPSSIWQNSFLFEGCFISIPYFKTGSPYKQLVVSGNFRPLQFARFHILEGRNQYFIVNNPTVTSSSYKVPAPFSVASYI